MTTKRGREHGQAVVETALVLTLFMTMVLGVIDLGRAAFVYNGLSNLAREASHQALIEYTSNSSSACYWNSFEAGNCLSEIKHYAVELQMAPGVSASNLQMSLTIDCGSAPAPGCTPGIPLSISMSTEFQPIVGSVLGIGPFTITAVSTSQFVLPVATPTPNPATATPCIGACPTFTPVPTSTQSPPEASPTNVKLTTDSGCTSNCETFDLTWTPPANLGALGHYAIQYGSSGNYLEGNPVPGTLSGSTVTNTTVDVGAPVHAICIKVTAVYLDGSEYPASPISSWHDSGTSAPTC